MICLSHLVIPRLQFTKVFFFFKSHHFKINATVGFFFFVVVIFAISKVKFLKSLNKNTCLFVIFIYFLIVIPLW